MQIQGLTKEKWLQFIWQYQLFNKTELETTTSENLEIIETGRPNTSQGPDFLGAKIRIGDKIWAGNVEIHLQEKDWLAHKHNGDVHYKNVILHVVYRDNSIAEKLSPKPIGTLSLEGRISRFLLKKYIHLAENKQPLACSSFEEKLRGIHWSKFKERLLVERFEERTKEWIQLQNTNHRDWHMIYLMSVAKAFGSTQNGVSFSLLVQHLGLENITKIKRKEPLLMDAVLFGIAGLLDNQTSNQPYLNQLRELWSFYKVAMKIEPSFVQLKFGHIRPSNNPFLRLSQLADFLRKYHFYCSEDFVKTETHFRQNIESIVANPFWLSNYSFQTKAKRPINVKLAPAFIDKLWVNAHYRFMFLYFNSIGKQDQIEALLERMEQRKAEVNFKTKLLKQKTEIVTLADSQASIQWHDSYCVKRRCLQCPLGVKILR